MTAGERLDIPTTPEEERAALDCLRPDGPWVVGSPRCNAFDVMTRVIYQRDQLRLKVEAAERRDL